MLLRAGATIGAGSVAGAMRKVVFGRRMTALGLQVVPGPTVLPYKCVAGTRLRVEDKTASSCGGQHWVTWQGNRVAVMGAPRGLRTKWGGVVAPCMGRIGRWGQLVAGSTYYCCIGGGGSALAPGVLLSGYTVSVQAFVGGGDDWGRFVGRYHEGSRSGKADDHAGPASGPGTRSLPVRVRGRCAAAHGVQDRVKLWWATQGD